MRLFLLLGLVMHKLCWEILKRTDTLQASESSAVRAGFSPVKVIKVTGLAALILQTLALEVFPIRPRPGALRGLGVALYLTGLTTAVLGRVQLGKNWADLEDARVLPDQAVVSHGLYRFIRHPIYAGDLLLVTGLQLALNSWLVLGSGLLTLIVFRRAAAEESLLVASLPGYDSYRRSTRRFIPFVF
jgi:protein-S-isoprenylcysteine O-methyltransferase Ste14